MNAAKRWPLAAALTAFALVLASTAAAGDNVISAGKLARDAKDFYGRTVTVRAEVEKIIDGHSFTLDEDALFAGPDVLVLLPRAVARSLHKDDKVTVTGLVRRYLVAELERDYDFFEDDHIVKSDVDVDFKTRPVLVATAVMMADGRDLLAGAPTAAVITPPPAVVTPSPTVVSPGRVLDNRPAPPTTNVTAGDLVRDAKTFYNRTVTVRAEVETVLDDHTFTLDEDALFAGPDVLVLLPQPVARSLRHDEKVTVTGMVRPFVAAELEREYTYFDDQRILRSDVAIDYKTRPVLIAAAVLTADGRQLLTGAASASASAPLPALPGAPAVAVVPAGLTIAAAALARNPSDMMGKVVTVRAPVGDLFDGRVFTLEEDVVLAGPDLVVLVPRGTQNVRRSDTVIVTGTVRPFTVAELRRDYPWFDETKLVIGGQALHVLGRPIIVADSVRTVSGVELVLR